MSPWHVVGEEQMPEPGRPVLVGVRVPTPRVMLAVWAPRKTLPAHPDCDGDYDEATDAYYASEGWYQCYTVNGELDDEPYWRIDDPVVVWMPTPAWPDEPPS